MALIDLPFTSFTPDLPAFQNPGFTRIHNCAAGRGSTQGGVTLYPLKRASLFSSTSMESRPLGSAVGQDRDGNARVYGGSSKALYKLSANTRQWTDISRSGGYTTGTEERWRFIEFGRLQIGSNYNDYPQYVDMNVDDQFRDLTTLVKGRYINTHKGFVIMGNTYDAIDGATTYRVRWSGLEAPSSWSPSPATQSDWQDIHGYGSVQGIVTDDSCYVLLQRGIVQMTYIGPPYVWSFTDRVVGKGCAVPTSVTTVENRHYFLSDDGFYCLEAGNLRPIGNGQIDQWFLDYADLTQAHLMTVASDPRESTVTWQFVSKDSQTGTPDMMLIYNYQSQSWTTADATTAFLFNAISLPFTLDTLDQFGSIDELPASFDSPLWAGGKNLLWGMSETGAIYSFEGPPLDLYVETPELQLAKLVPNENQADIARVDAVRPLFEGEGMARVQIGTRSLPNGQITWSEMRETNPHTGFCYTRVQSRYQRVRVIISGGWSKSFSLQIDAKAAGRR